jgi:hypothetical protein
MDPARSLIEITINHRTTTKEQGPTIARIPLKLLQRSTQICTHMQTLITVYDEAPPPPCGANGSIPSSRKIITPREVLYSYPPTLGNFDRSVYRPGVEK